MPRRTLHILSLAIVISLVCYARADRQPYGHYLSEILDLIDRHYVEPIDGEQLFESAVKGMTGGLDENSSFIAREDLSELRESLDQEFGGIGIEVGVDPETKELTVLSPMVGSPAYLAGLCSGDKIVAVDGDLTMGLKLSDIVHRLRGKVGDSVTLRIQRIGLEKPIDFVVARDKIPIESVRGDARRTDGAWDFRLVNHPQIGYLRIINFGERTAEEVAKAIDSLERARVKAVILDVRDNPGGLLPAAVEVCQLFIPPGKVIVTTRGRNGIANETFISPDGARRCTLPLCVLVNRYSASASEIVAACLQDYNRAKIIGERTFGKGTVQQIYTVEGGKSVLKLTTSSYWRPSEKNIHRPKAKTNSAADDWDDWGVRPDVGFDVTLTDEELLRWHELRRKRDILPPQPGEQRPVFLQTKPEEANQVDPQLEKAIQYLQAEIAA